MIHFWKAHPIIGYASWVQNDENQFGLYLKLGLICSSVFWYARTNF